MAGALALAGAGLVIALAAHGSWQLALPFAALWCASPLVARWVSAEPLAASQVEVSAADAQALRLIARRTWRFFESTVTPADNALPPDNFQEDPHPVLAHRTSPTNIGLYLLSIASAHDFGWIGLTETAERLEASFATLARLERFRGHFYNWYDTQDLRPLDPKYVSTVDSGNLAGHLIALANACRAWRLAQGIAPPLAGLADAAMIACEEAAALRAGPRTQTVTWNQLDAALGSLAAATRAATGVDGFASRLPSRPWLRPTSPALLPSSGAARRGLTRSSGCRLASHAIRSLERDQNCLVPQAKNMQTRLASAGSGGTGYGARDGIRLSAQP